jgi:hypothetical protein
MKKIILGLIGLAVATVLLSCTGKPEDQSTAYTKIDSLTDKYLQLKDSVMNTWNRMIYDDNQRLKAMKAIVHELRATRELDDDILKSLDYRIDQLPRIRYTQKTITNNDVIEEYDFATHSIVTEVVTVAETYRAYAYNNVLQELVERVRLADERMEGHRADYDAAARAYNQFLEANKHHLKEIDQSATFEKKPLFSPVSD